MEATSIVQPGSRRREEKEKVLVMNELSTPQCGEKKGGSTYSSWCERSAEAVSTGKRKITISSPKREGEEAPE